MSSEINVGDEIELPISSFQPNVPEVGDTAVSDSGLQLKVLFEFDGMVKCKVIGLP